MQYGAIRLPYRVLLQSAKKNDVALTDSRWWLSRRGCELAVGSPTIYVEAGFADLVNRHLLLPTGMAEWGEDSIYLRKQHKIDSQILARLKGREMP